MDEILKNIIHSLFKKDIVKIRKGSINHGNGYLKVRNLTNILRLVFKNF